MAQFRRQTRLIVAMVYKFSQHKFYQNTYETGNKNFFSSFRFLLTDLRIIVGATPNLAHRSEILPSYGRKFE